MEDIQAIPGGFGEEPEPRVAQQSTNEDYDMQDVVLTSRFSIPRPSEQWEIVMTSHTKPTRCSRLAVNPCNDAGVPVQMCATRLRVFSLIHTLQ